MSDLVKRARDLLETLAPAPWCTGDEREDALDDDMRFVEILDAKWQTIVEVRWETAGNGWSAITVMVDAPALLTEFVASAEASADRIEQLESDLADAVEERDTLRERLGGWRATARRFRRFLVEAGLDPDAGRST